MKYWFCLLFWGACAPTIGAQSPAPPVKQTLPTKMMRVLSPPKPLTLLIGGALEFGGDEVAKVYFTNGKTQSVTAGQGGTFFMGGQYQFVKVPQIAVRASLGIKYLTTSADNAHIRLTRLPLTGSFNWMPEPKLRFSVGIVSHRNIRFRSDGIGGDADFKPATGPVFEFAYRGIGLSYTALRYVDAANISYKANAVGLTFSGTIKNYKKKVTI